MSSFLFDDGLYFGDESSSYDVGQYRGEEEESSYDLFGDGEVYRSIEDLEDWSKSWDLGPMRGAAAPAFDQLKTVNLPPAIPGGYLEPSFHSFSTTDPSDIWKAIITVLEDLDIEYEAEHDLYKAECTAYRKASRAPFVIAVFSSDSKGKYAIEFQKQSKGCCFLFSETFRSFTQSLLDLSVELDIQKNTTACKQLLIDDDDLEVSQSDIEESVSSLINMCSSGIKELQCQAVQALAEMTFGEDKVTQKIIQSDSCIEAFLVSLSSDEDDMYRCGITGLVNLCDSKRCVGSKETAKKIAASKGGLDRIAYFANSQVGSNYVFRMAARTLFMIVHLLGASVYSGKVKERVQSLLLSPEPEIAQGAKELYRALTV